MVHKSVIKKKTSKKKTPKKTPKQTPKKTSKKKTPKKLSIIKTNTKKFSNKKILAAIIGSGILLNELNKIYRSGQNTGQNTLENNRIYEVIISTIKSLKNETPENIQINKYQCQYANMPVLYNYNYLTISAFYYFNNENKDYELKSNFVSYSAGKNKYIAKGNSFENEEKIINAYLTTNNNIKTFRYGIPSMVARNNYNVFDIVSEKYKEISGEDTKKFICICLLSPCNTVLCKISKSLNGIFPQRIEETLIEDNVINNENETMNNNGNIFVSIPLGNRKKLITLYSETSKSLNSSVFEKLVDIQNDETTFKSIVDITYEYYKNYTKTHILCYHCRSGKDRTGICDSIVQSTLYYLNKNKNGINYAEIMTYCKYFLMYSIIIHFYATGYPKLKLSNTPISKYILGNDYKFFT